MFISKIKPRHFSKMAQSANASRNVHTLPPLGYDYAALEPSISKEIMTLHHTKHHQTYVTQLNAAEKTLSSLQSEISSSPSPSLVKDLIALQPALKFNGGGHINHSLFWKNMAPTGSEETKFENVKDGKFGKMVQEQWGGLEGLKKEMNAKTAGVQGSGWGWLSYNKSTKKLEITTTANQDPLLTHVPIIGIDIWEHAFYLQYQNVKPDYLNAIWNVINFKEAERRLEAAL